MSLEKRTRGHWDFVLEEMAWMANDFMQVFSELVSDFVFPCAILS
jgi:hypothetical protein